MSYPDTPGAKVNGTSRTAARRITPHATTLRDRIHDFLRTNYPSAFTPDEIADRLRTSVLSTRPRISELLRGGVIIKTATRWLNSSGMPAVAVRWLRPIDGEVFMTFSDLKNKEIHWAIYQLRLVLARAGGVSASKAKIRIVFADRADCSLVTRALMQEIEPDEAPLQHPPRFQISGADVALLTLLTEEH
jgi:hypothetical protein